MIELLQNDPLDLLSNEPDPDADVPALVESQMSAAELWEKVRTLPERERKVIELHFLTQPPLSHRQIASRLGVGRSHIYYWEQRALRILRERYEAAAA